MAFLEVEQSPIEGKRCNNFSHVLLTFLIIVTIEVDPFLMEMERESTLGWKIFHNVS